MTQRAGHGPLGAPLFVAAALLAACEAPAPGAPSHPAPTSCREAPNPADAAGPFVTALCGAWGGDRPQDAEDAARAATAAFLAEPEAVVDALANRRRGYDLTELAAYLALPGALAPEEVLTQVTPPDAYERFYRPDGPGHPLAVRLGYVAGSARAAARRGGPPADMVLRDAQPVDADGRVPPGTRAESAYAAMAETVMRRAGG